MKRFSFVIQSVILGGILILPLLVTTAGAQQSDTPILVQGATTVAQLIDPWSKEFEQSNQAASVVIYGNTHGEGLKALMEGKAHVAMLARDLSPTEEAKLRDAGVKVKTEFLCYDAVAIVVHPENPVQELSLDQLRKLFSGEFNNWVQVGGPDMPVEVVVTAAESGMRTFLSSNVLGVPFLPNPALVTSPTKVLGEVGRRKGAIGYCRTQLALSSEKSDWIRPLAIRSESSSEPVALTLDNVRSKAYPIMRALWLCYDEAKSPESAKRFAEFCSGKVADKVALGK